MNDLRPIDGNGHVPDLSPASDKSADYRAGYNQATLDLMYAVLKKMHDDLTATLERLAA